MQTSPDDGLAHWLDHIGPMLAGLLDHVVGSGATLDHSAASLHDLERLLLTETLDAAPREGLVEALGGYLGEALLTVGGGAWVWDEGSGLPTAVLDAGGTVEPMPLVLDAVTRRTGTVWATEHERVMAEAARRRADDDGWEPRRADRPALPTRAEDDTPDPWLTRWLTTRRERFDAWSADTGRAGELDFSPASLVPLAQVVRLRIPSAAALDARIDDDLVQGAIWYLGEVGRIHRAARWRYTPDPDGTSENPSVGRPWVAQDDDGGGSAIPALELWVAVEADTDDVLLERFAEFD